MSDAVCAIVDPSGAFVLRSDLHSLARLSIDRVAPRDATGMLGTLVCGRRIWCACQRRPGHHGAYLRLRPCGCSVYTVILRDQLNLHPIHISLYHVCETALSHYHEP